MQTKRKIVLLLTSIMLLLVPVVGMAQGSGGHKPKPNPVNPRPPKPKPPRPPKPEPKPKVTPKAVDLGLPSGVKWATFNVGASSPEEYGDYFAWGETKPKSKYTEGNSKTYNKNIGDISGNPNYDAARANWGGSWRMPTKAEFQELLDKCNWTWTTYGGKKVYKVVGPNGNSIFLPAAGDRRGTSLSHAGPNGRYWSSTPNEGDAQGAYCLDFYDGNQYVDWYYRKHGQSVRPVTE